MNIWDKTDQELQSEIAKKNKSSVEIQTLALLDMLQKIGLAIKDNKEVSVDNIVRQVVGEVSVKRPDWIKELIPDDIPVLKKLDYIASAIIRKEVVRKMDFNRPNWLDEIKPKDIKFPENKEAEKINPVLKEILKAIKDIEYPEPISEIDIKEPKWYKPFNLDKYIEPLAKFFNGLQKKLFKVEVQNEITVKNQLKEITVKNPQKEVSVTNLKEMEKSLKLMTAQLQALGQTGSSGGGIDTTDLSKEDKQGVLERYELAQFDAETDPIYIGKVDKDGKWFIKKIEMSSQTARFYNGDSDFTTNWTNRASLSYDLFNNIF